MDEIYGAVFVRGAALGGRPALHGVDRFVVDGGDGEVRPGLGVNGIAWLTRDIVARLSNFWDKYVVDGLVNADRVPARQPELRLPGRAERPRPELRALRC